MEAIFEFLKEIVTNPSIRKTTLIFTITLSVIWFVYQTIADTSARTNKGKYRKSLIGQLVTGKSPEVNNDQNKSGISSVESQSTKTANNDIDMDVVIIKSLRNRRYLDENDESKKTSRGYNAQATYEDLRRIIAYSNEIREFVKSAKGGMESTSISSFRVYIRDNKVEIKSITIPPIKTDVQKAMTIDGIDSLKGIINDNRILSAFAFDAHK